MEILDRIRHIVHTYIPIKGEVLSDSPHQIKLVLLPDGVMKIGPLVEPLPKFIEFRNRLPSILDERELGTMTSDLMDKGIQLLMLLDPKSYLAAEDFGLLKEEEVSIYGSEVMISYSIGEVGQKTLGMPESTANWAADVYGKRWQTRIAISNKGFEIELIDPSGGLEQSTVFYSLPMDHDSG